MKLLYSFICIIILPSCLWQSVKPPESVVVVAPISVTTTIDLKDSGYLFITLDKKNYTLTLPGKSITTEKTSLVDSFLLQNKSFINDGKVMVTIKPNAPDSNFKKLVPLLKNIAITKFKLVSQ